MPTYKHGVYIHEQDTGLVTPVEADSALPVVVGIAPVHTLASSAGTVNVPKLIYNMAEFAAAFGVPNEGENYTDFTLYEMAKIYLDRYKVSPLVAINVFDPDTHKTGVTDEPVTISANRAKLAHGGVSSVTLTNSSGTTTYELGADYTLNTATGAIAVLPSGGLAAVTSVLADYEYADASKVTSTDVIGGVDGETHRRTGLSLVDEVFPRFRLVPGLVMAPGFSDVPAVGIAIAAACTDISGVFRAQGIISVPASVAHYTDAPAWLNDNNLTDSHLLCMFGSPTYGGVTEHGDIHLAGGIGKRDGDNDAIPFWSPSNLRMQADGFAHAGAELNLTIEEAAYLNGNGLITGLNMIGGLVFWGDQTCCYPGVTDVKDASLPVRRMFSFIGNTLVLTCWQKVSNPLRRRLIETVQDTVNGWLNGLVGREFILGGRVTFERQENPTTDLMDGTVRWHVYVTPPTAARELTFELEYDPSYLSTLFE